MQIKIADRLHDMQTIRYLPLATQRRKSAHTMQVVAPLAHVVGLPQIGAELERLASSVVGSAPPSGGPPAARPISRSARAALGVGALALPAARRDRALRDGAGELHTLCTVRARAAFVVEVLAGMPAMALSRWTGVRSVLVVAVTLLAMLLLVAAAVGRAARAAAWRQIALERRWDHERRERR